MLLISSLVQVVKDNFLISFNIFVLLVPHFCHLRRMKPFRTTWEQWFSSAAGWAERACRMFLEFPYVTMGAICEHHFCIWMRQPSVARFLPREAYIRWVLVTYSETLINFCVEVAIQPVEVKTVHEWTWSHHNSSIGLLWSLLCGG